MAPPSPDMKPSSPKEHGDTGLDNQQDQPQMAAPDSPARMSPARDTSDDTGATPQKDLTHADQQPSKAKQSPISETPGDITSSADEKQLPTSASVSSDVHTHLPDKAADGAPSESNILRSEDSVSSASKIDSLDNIAGTRSTSEVTSHDGETAFSGKTSLIQYEANDISSADREDAHGSTEVSLEDTLQAHGKSDDTSSPPSRKRTAAQLSIDGQLNGAKDVQHKNKKTRSTVGAVIGVGTDSSSALVPPELSQYEKESPDPTSVPDGASATRKKPRRAKKTASLSQSQQEPLTHESAIDRKIRALELIVGVSGQAGLSYETAPLANEPELQLDECAADLDLSALESILKHFPPGKSERNTLLTREALLLLFASNDCAPVLKQWKEKCYDNPDMQDSVLFALQETDSPWRKELEKLASCAMFYSQIMARKMVFEHEYRDAMMPCAMFVRRLVYCMSSYIITQFLDKCMFPDMERFLFEFGAGILLIVHNDLLDNDNGFFAKLLNSPFGTGVTSDVRSLWVGHLGLAGTEKDLNQWHLLNPSINIQRAAFSFGAAMRSTIKVKTNTYDTKLLVKETLHASSTSLTGVTEQFHQQADYYPDLLLAIDSQPAVSGLPKKVPKRIENHKTTCTVTPTCSIKHKRATPLPDNGAIPTVPNPDENPPPNKLNHNHQHFSQSDGRVVPCRSLGPGVGNPDPFTKREELILYKRYKAVIAEDFVEGGPRDSSKAWWEQWSRVAEVLPGRSVLDCIAYYNANKEHFQRE